MTRRIHRGETCRHHAERRVLGVAIESRAVVFGTCHEVSEPYGRQGDDHKVEGLQRGPTLDVFKNGRRERHKQQAAKKHKQQGGDDPDLRPSDVPMLQGRARQTPSVA